MMCDKWLHIYGNKLGTGANCEWVDDVRENVKGEWIYTPIENGMIVAMCSICKKASAITPSVKEWYRFCPNCGADMRG